jgi:hypothetical protein
MVVVVLEVLVVVVHTDSDYFILKGEMRNLQAVQGQYGYFLLLKSLSNDKRSSLFVVKETKPHNALGPNGTS